MQHVLSHGRQGERLQRSEERRVGKESRYTRCLSDWSSDVCSSDLLEIVSGNGQMTCPNVPNNSCSTYYPMVVRVSDSSGNPIAGKAVIWQLLVPGNGYAPTFDTNTLTDSNGLAVSRLQQTPSQGNFPFTQSVISAGVDGLSVSFTETQALLNGSGFPLVITALDPAEVGMTLSGP